MRRCLILAALLVAAAFALLPFLALAGEPILVAKTLYIDSDGDGVLDTDVSLAPSGTTPASDQLEITAPGGVEIVTGALVVTAGGATFAGELTATLDQNGTTDLTVSNPNAGASASARVSLTNDTGTVRAFELRGSGQASYADHLLIHVPAASLAGFFDNTTKELELAIDAANDEVTVAHDLVIEEAIVIESLGTTSAPAIHFAEGTVPANTGLRVTTSTGDLVFGSTPRTFSRPRARAPSRSPARLSCYRAANPRSRATRWRWTATATPPACITTPAATSGSSGRAWRRRWRARAN